MKKYRLKKCDMNVDELKIKALLEGLEAQNIEKFMREAKVGDYRNYGKAYVSTVKSKIKEQELFFPIDDRKWVCQKCGELVDGRSVTFEEYHEGCGGRCI